MKEVNLKQYKTLLDKAISYYCGDEDFIKVFGRLPLSRYYTFDCCFSKNPKVVIELGTSRSFVDGRFVGCNLDDTKYWEAENPEKWDWSAGCFTKVSSLCLPNSTIYTVDINPTHINRCKFMNKNQTNIIYNVSSSVDFLKKFSGKADLIYLDTGDMTPIEPTAQLQLEEVQVIVNRKLLNPNGLLLIDDVKNLTPVKAGETSLLGKSKYSIPYLQSKNFKIIMDEYQVIMQEY